MLIRIIKIPNGPAPQRIREAWVGLKFRAEPFDDPMGPKADFIKVEKVEGKGGYIVLADEAIEKLRKVSPDAASWFREFFPEGSGKHLVFGSAEVEVIETS